MEKLKVCSICHKEKPLKEFPYNTGKVRYFSYCHQCRRDKYKGNENTHKRVRNRSLVKQFGITLDEYNLLFLKQGGKCAICGIHQSELKQALNLDHDHTTGKVRALLCPKCNGGLGIFNDDIDLLEKAIKYLKLCQTD